MKTISEQAEAALIGASNKITLGGAGTAGAAKVVDATGAAAWLMGYSEAILSAMSIVGGASAFLGMLASVYFQWRRNIREERNSAQ